jgi:Zn-dependent protease
MSLTPDQIRWVFIYLFVLVISVALHEFGHAFMADRLGDDTPRRQGRVTLNPIAHADPIGTLLLPLAGAMFGAASGHVGGFGWGKPVEWQASRIRRGISMSTARILVAIAGPSMNLLLGTVIALVHVILAAKQVIDPAGNLSQILYFASTTNFILFFFNLLPLPPLDGGHVAESFMPYKYRRQFESFARYAPFVILGFMLIPEMQQVFAVPARWCTNHVYQLFFSIFS